MTLSEFRASVQSGAIPPDVTPLLKAMWHDANGDWEKAHQICQEIETQDGAHVHAYLHRKEGDLSNAGYWYRRAGTKLPSVGLDEEWEKIVVALLRQD